MLKNYGNAKWNLCKVIASLASTCSLCNLALRQTQHQQQAAGSASVCVAAWLRGLAAVAVAFASGHSPLRAFALLWLIYGHAHKSGWPAWADYKQSGGEGREDGGNREEDEDSARISVSALLSVTHAQSKRECKNKSASATHCGVADDEIPRKK